MLARGRFSIYYLRPDEFQLMNSLGLLVRASSSMKLHRDLGVM